MIGHSIFLLNYSFEGEEILFVLLRVVFSALSTVNDIW